MAAMRVLVLLFLSLGFMASWGQRQEAPQGPPPPRWHYPSPGVLPNPILLDPELRECWTHLRRPPGCMSSIYDSSDKGKVSLSRDCCKAVEALTSRCFVRIFTAKPFQPDFSQKVKDFCTSGQGASLSTASSP
ncbi:Egg cell-secreted protein 1.2 [Apostasia shenzhenica]|uniref:Egg cell-secreted protein 1.2 n=1 Tax=Apostasia shenzhenica TaxID=1088818 RepID=A0A2I0AAD9_9ASPA|nr:Egg cell-secreted protein 1.2 [Apostasia shenzhenica]